MKITVIDFSVLESEVILNPKTDNISIPLADFKSFADQNNGRKWEVETAVDGVIAVRTGIMPWHEFFISWRATSLLESFALKNVRRRNA